MNFAIKGVLFGWILQQVPNTFKLPLRVLDSEVHVAYPENIRVHQC